MEARSKLIAVVVVIVAVAASATAVLMVFNKSADLVNSEFRVIVTGSMDGEPRTEYEIETIPVTGQFEDLRNTGWVYAVSMQLASGQTSSETWDQTPQYAYYDGNPSGTWTYAANGGLKLTDEKTYDITLYIAAKTTDGGFGSPFRPADDIIAGGIIQFTFDSSN